MDVPFVDLKIQYKTLKSELDAAMANVIQKTDFILGNDVSAFEQEFAEYLGSDHGIGVASGTDSLILALKSIGIEQGDEVITAANTYIATFLAISHAGATPVPVDIDPISYNINPELIEQAITPRTKAILPVHLFGQAAEMDEINKIAQKHNLYVIEDACQAHGAFYKGKRTGTLGTIGCFSFYPSKNLGCYGDGGFICTNDSEIAEKIRLMRNYGQNPKNVHSFAGYNSRLDTLQASILRKKLPHLDSWNQARAENARLYNKLLNTTDMITPDTLENRTHVFHLYVVRVRDRELIQKRLGENNIQSGVHYPIPSHLQGAYSHLKYHENDFPITEKYANEILSLPMYPELTAEMVHQVTDTLKSM